MFCKISGYDESELIGRNHRVINSGIHPTEFFAEMWSTVLRGVVWRREICNKRKDGSLYWVDSTIVPLKNIDGRVQELMAIRFDVTAAKETKLKLLQASKMAALGEASAHLAHEVNTPLAVIISKVGKILRMLTEGEMNSNLISHEVEKVQKTAHQISEIIKGLKHFSRSADKDQFQVCDLDVVLKEVLVLCGERLDEEGVQLMLKPEHGLKISARPAQIYQVLLNLINNSIDAISDKPEKWIEIATRKSGDHVLILVTDCGDGIPKDIADKIMEPFFTTKGVEKGTGLGLSVSAEILSSHHGRLYVDHECKNTRFVMEFPAAATHRGAA
jgi:PAS domain S-box-containing protein